MEDEEVIEWTCQRVFVYLNPPRNRDGVYMSSEIEARPKRVGSLQIVSKPSQLHLVISQKATEEVFCDLNMLNSIKRVFDSAQKIVVHLENKSFIAVDFIEPQIAQQFHAKLKEIKSRK